MIDLKNLDVLSVDYRILNDSCILICGDSFDILQKIKIDVDSVITDPPYNYDFLNFDWDSNKIDQNLEKYKNRIVSHIPQNNRKGGVKSKKWYETQFNLQEEFKNKVKEFISYVSINDGGYIAQFSDHLSAHVVIDAHNTKFFHRDTAIWVRNSGIPRGRPAYRDGFPELKTHRTITTNTYEPIIISQTRYNGNIPQIYRNTGLGYLDTVIDDECITNVFFDKKVKTDKNIHPTSKPLSLIEKLVKIYCPKNKIVLDPFMGSGTTGVACVNSDRKFIGIERDPIFFNFAANRIKEAINHKEKITLAGLFDD